MDEQQIDTLLQQLSSAKAPKGMKDAIMAKIEPAPSVVEASVTSAAPLEKGFLILSLLTGFIFLVFMVDMDFFNKWMIKPFTTLQLMFSQNMIHINKAAGFAGKLPMYLLFTLATIAVLLLLEKLVLKKVFTRINFL